MAKTEMNLRKFLTSLTQPKLHQADVDSPAPEVSALGRFSRSELRTMVGRVHTSRDGGSLVGTPDMSGLISYLRPEHVNIVQVIEDSERFMALAPEIKQACMILVSSIVSPNDLQDCEPAFSVPNVKNIDGTILNRVCDLLKDYFNHEFNLGGKFSEWCEEILFRSGAVPLLIMPEKSLAHIISPETLEKEGVGKESLDTLPPTRMRSMYDKVLKTKIYDRVGLESFTGTTYTQDRNRLVDKILPLVQQDLDRLSREERSAFGDIKNEELRAGIESVTVKFASQLEDGDVLNISENPEILRFGKVMSEKRRKSLGNKLDEQYRQSSSSHNLILSLLDHIDVAGESVGHPFVMQLPAEAVIPVNVPGSKKERLGYFVLIDAFGQPVEASAYLNKATTTDGNLLAADYSTIFGSKMSSISKMPTSLTQFGNPWDLQKHTMTRVFDFVLDNMLRKKLQDVGLGEVEVSKFNTISTCMFHRYLEKKHTSLVFVPESILTYICFDYRDNGTGKTKLEDIHFVLSLRVTLLVAAIMSMMKNAIDHKKMDVTMDEKIADPAQLIEQLKSSWISKHKLSFHTDPTQIHQDILRQSLTIVPKGMAGVNFEIDHQDQQSQIVKADTELLDALSNMMVTALGVPYSALNQLSENEFSRSIATTNLFFSKHIQSYQKILCDFAEHFLRNYIRYSPPLIEEIEKILKTGVERKEEAQTEDGAEKGSLDTEKDKQDGKPEIKQMIQAILSNLRVSLPTPNLAPDKAQFAEVKEFLEMANDLLEVLYNPELVSGGSEDEEKLTKALTLMKAHIRKNFVETFAKRLGVVGSFDFPSIEDALARDMLNMTAASRQMRNFYKGFELDEASQKVSAGGTDEQPGGMGGAEPGADTPAGGEGDEYGDNYSFPG